WAGMMPPFVTGIDPRFLGDRRLFSTYGSLGRRPFLRCFQRAGVFVDAAPAVVEHLSQPPDFVAVGPQDSVALDRRFAAVYPAADGPVAQLHVAHVQLPRQ